MPALTLSGGQSLALGSSTVQAVYRGSELKHFNPKAIPGLQLWLDANDASTITLNSGNVSSWADKSGTSKPATANENAATQPAYSATGANGKPQIEFDNNETLTVGSSAALFNYLHGGAGAAVFMVMRAARTSDPNSTGGILNNAGGVSSNVGIATSFDDRVSLGRNNYIATAIFRGQAGVAAAVVESNNYLPDADALIVNTWRIDPSNANANQRLFQVLNGTQSAATNSASAAASTSNATTNLIFGSQGGSSGFTGALSEVLIYEGQLSASQRQAVERYLGRKWGVTVA